MKELITLAEGAGGSAGEALMKDVVFPYLGNEILAEMHDGARLKVSGDIAFTTDSYVVSPRFFPGGSIGTLAVSGTVNDLAMTGAKARFLSAAVILEEGFPVAELKDILADMKKAAEYAGVLFVTGDTKVAPKGKIDGVFINTAGIGDIIEGADISPKNVKTGMKIIVSGSMGDHGATILAARHNMKSNLKSDAAPLNKMVEKMFKASKNIAALRDPTRGGLAATLNEIAKAANVGIIIDEAKIPIKEEVKGLSDMLGFDPLTLANEGKLVAFVPKGDADAVLAAVREDEHGKDAEIIGETTDKAAGKVGMKTPLGSIRVVEMPRGIIVPRIC
ncbi:MAG: hydrogenase expression/formation protein HypE [Selenomonadaceae bacterium]|nr:hydrogenase expression/formation protein HypE [Selenomonadaceae bacterium]